MSTPSLPQTRDTDNTAPRVTSITRQTLSSSPPAADSLTWRVTFNEAVQNVDAADFQISGTTSSLTAAGVDGTNAYDVTASGGDLAGLTGTVTLSFVNGQNIEDSNGNALTTTTPTGTKGLERVAAAEAWLLARGYGQVRVRSQGATARIEIPAAAIADFLSHVDRSQLVDHFRTLGFTAVGLDLEGLVSGKLNRALPSSPGPLASGVAVDQQ